MQRQRGDYVRKRHVGQPGHAVVGRLARPHPVARGAGAGGLATGRCPLSLVVPDGEEAAIRGDRKIGLPLGLGGIDIGVEHEGSAKGHPAVRGADVEDVAGVAVASVARGIDVVNYAVEGGRLTPAHVSPVSRVAVHGGEVARRTTAGAIEGGAGVGVGPSVAAVG